MVHQERLEIGEKCFVAAIMAVLATEAILTIINNGVQFSWIGLALGVVGFCLALFLANRLYAGNRQAVNIALGWIGFQVVYAAVALALHAGAATMAGSEEGGQTSRSLADTARMMGAALAWAVVLKAAVYLSLAWVLIGTPAVRDFFAEKRGESRHYEVVERAEAPEPAPAPGVPLNLTADQLEDVGSLARFIRRAALFLVVLGALEMISGVLVGFGQTSGVLIVLEGLLTALLGLALGPAAGNVQHLMDPEDRNTAELSSAFGGLHRFFTVQAVLGALLAVVVVVRLIGIF